MVTDRKFILVVPIKISGPDRDILILLSKLKLFYFALGLTKAGFFSDF